MGMHRAVITAAGLALIVNCGGCGRSTLKQAAGHDTGSPPRGTATGAASPAAGPRAAAGGGEVSGRGWRGGRGLQRWQHGLVRFTPDEERAIGVQTVSVTARSLRSEFKAMGTIAVPLERKAVVSTPLPARVARVDVGIGAWVSRGQVLVALQCEEIGNAKAEYHKALAAVQLARRSFEREKSLFDRGVGAQKSFYAAENELKVAEATLAAADKRLHVLGFSESDVTTLAATHEIDSTLTLVAPITGKVVSSTAVLGTMVEPSIEIMTLVDPRDLWVDAEVYERDIARVRVGQKASVQVPAYPDRTFEGTITYIGDAVNAETRTIAVRTSVPNPSQQLKPGMFADVSFLLERRSTAPILPDRAILADEDARLVFVRTAAGYEPRTVTVGAKEGDCWEVLDGVAVGELVVVNGQYQLKSKLLGATLKGAAVH